MSVCFRSLLVLLLLFDSIGLQAEEPSELTTSRANYQKALDRATAPIHEKYLQHLKRLQSEFTRKNDLDAALAIRTEIETLEGAMKAGGVLLAESKASPEKTMEEELAEWLQDREFRWEGSTVDEVVVQFDGDKVRAEADGRELFEKKFAVIAPNAIQFEWSNREMNTFTIDDRKRSFTRFMARSGESHPGTIHAR